MADHSWFAEELRRKSARLSPADRNKELHPWRRAYALNSCFLYWIPVHSFPIPLAQRRWLIIFLERVSGILATKSGLRSEIFLQYKVIYPNLAKAFVDNAVEFGPIAGLGLQPGARIPKPITENDISELMKGKKFDFNDWVADYTYWFTRKAPKKQRELFFGYGGMTNILLKPDEKIKPPTIPFSPAIRNFFPIFQTMDVQALVDHTFALSDSFQAKSKQLFGEGLKDEPQFRGLRFILPLLCAKDFFNEMPQQRERWFQLFEIYINESPKDDGILLGSTYDLDQQLIELITQMRDEGLEYPER